MDRAGGRFQAVLQIEAGLSIGVVDRLAGDLGIPAVEVRELARISPSTFSRRQKSGVLSPEESDRVHRLQSVLDRATVFFEGDRPAASKWLKTPQGSLGGLRPVALLVNDAGVREVEAILGRLEHGVFA